MISEGQEFQRIGRMLLGQKWIFAKTMPHNPHEYTLRKLWTSDADFVHTVEYIRAYGYRASYQGRPYVQLNVNDRFYWTMGAPIKDTILINRKVLQSQADYDAIAPVYDDLFTDPESQQENIEIIGWLGDLRGKTLLDVGCGTGFLLDYAKPGTYLGIDPSWGMLDRLLSKHPQVEILNTPLCSFVSERSYDLVVALFGAASYLSDEELALIPGLLASGGRYLLMFYSPGYVPKTYQETGVYVEHRNNIPAMGETREWGNYVILAGR